MDSKNLLKDSKAYYEDNDYYELFSIAEDGENKVTNYLAKISKNKNILDAGCGTGKFLQVLESNSNKYIGIDLSQDQLDKAKLKSKKNSSLFIKSNLKDINIKNKSVDLIVSSWVLGTITDINERLQCLNKLKSFLSNNGQIILIENDLNSEFEEIRGRTKDNRTLEYNDWILSNGFIIDKKFDTYFKFNSLNEAKKCFEIIYGKKVGKKIKKEIINHKIIIFKYKK